MRRSHQFKETKRETDNSAHLQMKKTVTQKIGPVSEKDEKKRQRERKTKRGRSRVADPKRGNEEGGD